MTADEIEQVLQETCVDLGSAGYDTVYGWGFLNAYNAVEAVTSEVPGDYDGDGDVHLFDFAHWDECMTGPDNGPVSTPCQAFDFEPDDDVDLSDFAAFQGVFTGP